MPNYRRAKLAIYSQLNKEVFSITHTQMYLLTSFVTTLIKAIITIKAIHIIKRPDKKPVLRSPLQITRGAG